MAGRGQSTRFPPGVSGNPGGRPANAAIQTLARRYTVDAVSGLVWVSRLRSREQASAIVAACRELVQIGHGQSAGAELTSALHLHLLAVQQVIPPDQNETFTDPPTVENDGEMAHWDRPGLLPAPSDDLPDEALPLWDAYRVRRSSDEVAADLAGEGETPVWEPMPWPKQD